MSWLKEDLWPNDVTTAVEHETEDPVQSFDIWGAGNEGGGAGKGGGGVSNEGGDAGGLEVGGERWREGHVLEDDRAAFSSFLDYHQSTFGSPWKPQQQRQQQQQEQQQQQQQEQQQGEQEQEQQQQQQEEQEEEGLEPWQLEQRRLDLLGSEQWKSEGRPQGKEATEQVHNEIKSDLEMFLTGKIGWERLPTLQCRLGQLPLERWQLECETQGGREPQEVVRAAISAYEDLQRANENAADRHVSASVARSRESAEDLQRGRCNSCVYVCVCTCVCVRVGGWGLMGVFVWVWVWVWVWRYGCGCMCLGVGVEIWVYVCGRGCVHLCEESEDAACLSMYCLCMCL